MKRNCHFLLILLCVFSFKVYSQPSTSFQWVKNLGGPSYDYGTSVAVDGSGNVYTTGYFRGTSDFDPGSGVYSLTSEGINDIFVTKLDAAGNLVWAIGIGGSDDDFGKGIVVDATGNVYFTGYFKGTVDFNPGAGTYSLTSPNGADNAFICKLDASGNFVFALQIIPDPGFPGMPSSKGLAIALDINSNILVNGSFGGGNDFDPGAGTFIFQSNLNEGVYVLKLDSDGNFIWAKRMGGGDNNNGADCSIASDASGNVYTTGYFRSTADFDPGTGTYFLTSDGWDDAFVTKLDASGSFVWAKQFGGIDYCNGKAIVTDALGNTYITGKFTGTVDFDPGTGIQELTNVGSADIFLVRLNSNGDFAWVNRFGSGYFNQQGGYSLAIDQYGDIYMAGLYSWTVDFDPGSGTANLTSSGNLDFFIAKYDGSGNYIWAKGIGGTGELDFCASLKVDLSNNLYATGNFQSTFDFNPGYQVYNNTSNGQMDAFVLKLSQCNNTVNILTETVCDLYTLNGVEYDSSGVFHQYFVNSQGCDSIITLNLTVNTSPSIISESDTLNKCLNTSVDISVSVAGTTPLTYQWYKDGGILSSASSESIYINVLQASDDGLYTCEITNGCGTVTTTGTELQVIQITVDPGSDTAFCNNNPVQLQAAATSNYPAASGVFSFMWSPPQGLSASNISNPLAQPMGDTQYQIVATDEMNCPGMAFLNVYSHTPANITQQPQPGYNLCLMDTLTLTVTADGSAPLSFQWTKDGTAIPTATGNSCQIISASISDQGVYACTVSNYCNNISTNNITVNVIDLTITASSDTGMCKGQSALLHASASSNHSVQSGTLTYTWTPSTGLNVSQGQNVTANPIEPTDYTISVTDINGCSIHEVVSVDVYLPFNEEKICLVTVDTLSWKNKIMWEKTPGVGTIGYNVYKEVASNVYSSIGFIPYDEPAEYVDLYSQPESYANRYKISVIDTCSNESEKSYYHNTMNLTIAAFGSTMGLSWTPYSDESGDFVPALYDIYRGTNATNMTYLASIPGTQTSYNDNNIFTVYYYIVGVTKPGGCNTEKSDLVSYSNKKDNTGFIGIEDNNLLSGTILISPNPMTTSVTLFIPNFSNQSSVISNQLMISDITGKVVRVLSSEEMDNLQINSSSNLQIRIVRGDLKPGIYFVELKADKIYRGKLIIE